MNDVTFAFTMATSSAALGLGAWDRWVRPRRHPAPEPRPQHLSEWRRNGPSYCYGEGPGSWQVWWPQVVDGVVIGWYSRSGWGLNEASRKRKGGRIFEQKQVEWDALRSRYTEDRS